MSASPMTGSAHASYQLPAAPPMARVKTIQSDSSAAFPCSPIVPPLHSPSPSTPSSSSHDRSSSDFEEDIVSTPPSSPEREEKRSRSIRTGLPLSPLGSTTAADSEPPATIDESVVALSLLFSSSVSAVAENASDLSAPPAFFPNQCVAFSPRLRVNQAKGLRVYIPSTSRSEAEEVPLEGQERLCGLMLAVTGVAEILAPSKNGRPPVVKSTRLVADFCTDLSNGVKIWQKDAAMVISNRRTGASQSRRRRRGVNTLPPGTYVLPLSMKIPASEKMPPSFESQHFRIVYTMSLALFSSTTAVLPAGQKPRLLKLVHLPFQILPSTLPSIPPSLPVLTHSTANGFLPSASSIFSSVAKAVTSVVSSSSSSSLSDSAERSNDWHISTSLPTASFSPSGSIPISLKIRSPSGPAPIAAGTPGPLQQIFVRLTLLRRIYVRESSLSIEQDSEWGLGLTLSLADDLLWERWEKEEREICQVWGTTAMPVNGNTSKTIRDIPLPLSALFEAGASAGYSSTLDLAPNVGIPSLRHGESSWFSPAVEAVVHPSNAKAHDKHTHVSSRFFVAVEVGFLPSNTPLQNATPGVFKLHHSPSPYAPRRSNAPTNNPSHRPAFPGKLRELLVPVVIGSVAEPGMACLNEEAPGLGPNASSSSIDDFAAAQEEWRGEARGPTAEGEDGNSRSENQERDLARWILPPPVYQDACKAPPYHDC